MGRDNGANGGSDDVLRIEKDEPIGSLSLACADWEDVGYVLMGIHEAGYREFGLRVHVDDLMMEMTGPQTIIRHVASTLLAIDGAMLVGAYTGDGVEVDGAAATDNGQDFMISSGWADFPDDDDEDENESDGGGIMVIDLDSDDLTDEQLQAIAAVFGGEGEA